MNRWLKPILSIAIAATALTGCATPNAGVEIVGEVWYRERIALPQDAVLKVQVKDVSLMDAPAVILAEIERDGVTSPTPFHFLINRDQFESGHTYAIGARIEHNDKLMFINTQAFQIDLGSTEPLSIRVDKVSR